MATFTQELFDTICNRIAQGESLRAICREKKMPDAGTVMRWVANNDERRAQYARAREDQADADADRIGDIADKVLSGEIDPNSARVAIDALKWSAGKRKPKVYGDKMQVDGPGAGGAFLIQWKNADD